MRLRYVSILLLVAIISCGYDASAQDDDDYDDSLQESILQSVQGKFDANKFSKMLRDSLKQASLSVLELRDIFQDVNKEIKAAQSTGDIESLGKGYRKLSTIDSLKGNYKSAYENYKLYSLYRDSLQKKELEKKDLQMRMQQEFDKKQAAQQAEKAKEERSNLIRLIFLVAILLVFVAVAVSSFIAYKRERKAKGLVNVQKTELETTLSDLKATQLQLIHAEKMASLGELTAGIAHEIQNPLNFVNNFSEVNKEMIAELKEEIDKGNYGEVKTIATDIEANQDKIAHHGRRADSIVKGMLLHARKNSGQKELTDINALCDEYLRLSYHGLRAKDKSFIADIKTDFDKRIGKTAVVPQEMGRALLNLCNNAFYAVNEKLKAADETYKPTVSLQTKKLNGNIEISISDNGVGISQDIVGKIFQPFFTTKPTGQGTGLGLSLAYDIITKEHGGTIRAESREGEGTTFIIALLAGKEG